MTVTSVRVLARPVGMVDDMGVAGAILPANTRLISFTLDLDERVKAISDEPE